MAFPKNVHGAVSLTGGGQGALDAIDGAGLDDLDAAVVIMLNKFFLYSLDADSATAESSPEIISPDANAGDKRWILSKVTNSLEDLTTDIWAQQFNNLLKAGGFPSFSAGVDGATHYPDGWSAEGTPANVKRETADVGYGKYAVRLTTDAVNEGINQTISGLKASTKYTILGRGKATAGDTARLFTTGATTNVDDETTSTSWANVIGTFTTDGSGTNVVVKLVGKANGDIVWFCGLICVEGTIAPVFAQHPNDQHLKAIDFQNISPTNFDYGLLRMECGMCRATHLGAGVLGVTVTFGTAFRTTMMGLACLTDSVNGFAMVDANMEGIENRAANNMVVSLRDAGGAFIAGDWADMYWIAIGVGP